MWVDGFVVYRVQHSYAFIPVIASPNEFMCANVYLCECHTDSCCASCCCCCSCCRPRLQHLKLWFFAFKFRVNKISVCKLLMLFMQLHAETSKNQKQKCERINYFSMLRMKRKQIESSKQNILR